MLAFGRKNRGQGYTREQRKLKGSLGYVRSTQKHEFGGEEEEEGNRGRKKEGKQESELDSCNLECSITQKSWGRHNHCIGHAVCLIIRFSQYSSPS